MTAIFSLAWGVVMGASALAALSFHGWQTTEKIGLVSALFALGGATGFPIGLALARRFSRGRGADTAFAAMLVATTSATLGMTLGFFVLRHCLVYWQSHDAPLSVHWLLQIVITVLASGFEFAVLGLRLYFPIGVVATIIASFWFARLPR